MSNTTSNNRIIAVVPVAYTQATEDGKTEDIMVLVPVCSPEDSAKLPHADVIATIVGNERLEDSQVEALGAYTLALQDDILTQSNTKLEGEALTTAQQSIFQAELEILEAILSKQAADAATATPEVPTVQTTAEEAAAAVEVAAEAGNEVAQAIQNLPATQQAEANAAFTQLASVMQFGAEGLNHVVARRKLKAQEEALETEYLAKLAAMLQKAPSEIAAQLQAALPAEVTA